VRKTQYTQYDRILDTLRRAGKRGCTIHDLVIHSNYPSRRISELESKLEGERIERGTRIVNSRAVRVYRLVRA
jgi:hypothetical protein